MAEDFLKNTFGMNVKLPEKTIRQVKETAKGTVSNLWEPLFTFIDDNQPVFTGNVANEIEKYNLMMFNLGAQLRKGDTFSELNIKG